MKSRISKMIAAAFVSVSACVSAHAWCFDEAAQTYGISSDLLRAIAQHESGLRPDVQQLNTNNTRDIGLMGINTVHIAATEPLGVAGFSVQALLDPCTNVRVGAWLLKRKFIRYGEGWFAVGAYHSLTPELNAKYQRKIWDVLRARRASQ
jgi:soluble lytic murein transglycosylase-like protein